jgi:hypothetical protein
MTEAEYKDTSSFANHYEQVISPSKSSFRAKQQIM